MFPSLAYLDQLQIPYTTEFFSPSTPMGASNVAHVLGLSEHQTVKSLIFETDKEEQILIMVSGDVNVISGHKKKVVGSRNIKLASPEKVNEITGYQIGSIPPFSWQPEGFRSFLDLELTHQSVLAAGAGVWGNEILITPTNLIITSKAEVGNLRPHESPIDPAE